MLAAIRARPVPTLLPDSGGNGFVTAFAAKGGRALVDQPLAASGDGGHRWFAGMFRGELATCRPDLLPAVAADRRRDPGVAEDRLEALDDGHRACCPRRVCNRGHRDQVDMGVIATKD